MLSKNTHHTTQYIHLAKVGRPTRIIAIHAVETITAVATSFVFFGRLVNSIAIGVESIQFGWYDGLLTTTQCAVH